MKRQAAVFVTVPAEAIVGDFRARHQPRAVARRLPPHITILPPFLRDVADDDLLAARLTQHFSSCPWFPAELVRVGRFKRHVWLAPEPHDRFVELLGGARRRFSEFVRDDDREPVPHLTIAETGKRESTGRVAELAERELSPQLPFRFDVEDVGLFEVRREGWHELLRFELA